MVVICIDLHYQETVTKKIKGKFFFTKPILLQELTGVVSVISSVKREEGDIVGHSIWRHFLTLVFLFC